MFGKHNKYTVPFTGKPSSFQCCSVTKSSPTIWSCFANLNIYLLFIFFRNRFLILFANTPKNAFARLNVVLATPLAFLMGKV